MMTLRAHTPAQALKSVFVVVGATLLLAACGGESTESLPNTSAN